MGYLEQHYLGGDLSDDLDLSGATDAEGPTTAGVMLTQMGPELIVLPGGITMKRETFWLLAGVAVVALLLVYAKRKKEAAA